MSEGAPVLRIGELSRRAGVSGHVLRAWERRYGSPQPVRSDGGFRLYTEADEKRIRQMRDDLAAPPGCRAAQFHAAGRRRHGSDGSTGLAPRSRGRASRGPAAGLRRLRRAGRAGDPGPARIRFVGDRGHARDRAPLPSGTRGSVGAGATQASPRNTSPATSSAGGWAGWPAAGATGAARGPSWPARPESGTTWP